jgi:phage terminase large subunit-like protein
MKVDQSGPAKVLPSTGRSEKREPSFVLNAVRLTTALACALSTATRTAEQQQVAELTATLVLDVVKVNRADVYDITVEGDAPEFYAGSGRLLVHNCKWKYPKQSWDAGIMPSLRADLAGDHPRAFVTTTPKPIDLLQEWVKRNDETVHIIRGSTFDNSANLSQLVVAELRKRYDGTNIGRQELYGEIVEGFDGALFTRLDIENNRILKGEFSEDLVNIVVGVDPSLTGEDDEMGIVVVGRDRNNHLYVLEDASLMGVGRSAALAAWRVVARWGADKLVCEVNLGKRWMQQVFNDAYYEMVGLGEFEKNTKPPLLGIDTKIGKKTRGEPVAMRNEQGKLHNVGYFPELEDQMATFTSWGTSDSPDRLDALVHACRFLIDGEKKQARITSPSDVLSTTLQSLWNEAGSYRADF